MLASPPRAVAHLALLAGLWLAPFARAQENHENEAAVLYGANPTGGQFGRGTAMAGPGAMVGDLAHPSVTFYRRGPKGWTRVWADRGPLGSMFGRELHTDGETLAIGAVWDGWPDDLRGSVRIYELLDGRWEAVQGLHPPASLESDKALNFGDAVAVDGDVMAIGVPGVDEPHHFSGMVLIYEREQGVWIPKASFGQETVDGPVGQQWGLGTTCDVVGDTVVAGASGDKGAVYTYERDAQGWHRAGILHEPNPPDEGKTFGSDVALSRDGSLLVVGQASPDSISTPFVDHPGRAHVFERTASGGWSRLQVLHASDEHFVSGGTQFGLSVDIEGRAIVVGAKDAKGAPSTKGDEGAAYLYLRRPDGTWPATEDRRWWGSAAFKTLGRSVALERGFAVVGGSGEPAHVFEIRVGETFCPATPNSTGESGVLSAVGSPAIAENMLTLSARDCPPDRPGTFLMSDRQALRTAVGDGALCLGEPRLRLGEVAATGPTGAAHLELDLQDPRYAGLITPGSTLHFQYWFSEATGAGANLTAGVAVTFE